MNEDSFASQPLALDVMADVNKVQIKLQRLAGQEDKAAGMRFFYTLLGLLGGLVVLYVVMHLIFPLRAPGSAVSSFMWDASPWRYVEVIFWGLAGVLINKIISSGWFLRSQRFYREGTIMHVAHLVATPLLVFVAVLILSLATLKLTLGGVAGAGGTEVSLDLSQLPVQEHHRVGKLNVGSFVDPPAARFSLGWRILHGLWFANPSGA
jgi:hypothetical protein